MFKKEVIFKGHLDLFLFKEYLKGPPRRRFLINFKRSPRRECLEKKYFQDPPRREFLLRRVFVKIFFQKPKKREFLLNIFR